MGRVGIFIYGVVCYVMFLGVFLYAFGFVTGWWVPKTLDSPAVTVSFWTSMVANAALLLIFGLQHSVMARPTFKRWWTRIIPPAAERSTYVLMSNLCLIALFIAWQPLPAVVWNVHNTVGRIALWALCIGGWFMVLVTTFLINHFDLFGLRQIWLHLRGREYTHLHFATPLIYKHIRHPLYVGWITAFWATPTMTLGHLLFAAITTAYILVAIVFEERNLVEYHGSAYQDYRERTGKLLPRLRPCAHPAGTRSQAEPAGLQMVISQNPK
jgi:protein-S-isoprenylcysteine O-methyltransferase Ste14